MEKTICTQEQMENRAVSDIMKRLALGNDINNSMPLTLTGCSAQTRSLELSHKASPWDMNLQQTMHGGLICLMLDANMGILCRAYTGDKTATTLDIHVNFLRAVMQGEELHSSAVITHMGGRVVRLNAEAWTLDRNELCATASATFYRPKREE